jgi:hypothetical protein
MRSLSKRKEKVRTEIVLILHEGQGESAEKTE